MLQGLHLCPFHMTHGSVKVWVHVVGPFAQLRCCWTLCRDLAGIWRPLDLCGQRVADFLGRWRQLIKIGSRRRQQQGRTLMSQVAQGGAVASQAVEATALNASTLFGACAPTAAAAASAAAAPASASGVGPAVETASALRLGAAGDAPAGRERPHVLPVSAALSGGRSSMPTPATDSIRGPALSDAARNAVHGGALGAAPRPFPDVPPPRPLSRAPPPLLPRASASHGGPNNGVVHPPMPQFHVPPQVRPPPPRPVNGTPSAAAAAPKRQSFDPRRPRPAAVPTRPAAPLPRPSSAFRPQLHPTSCTKPCCMPSGIAPRAVSEPFFGPPCVPHPVLGAPLPVPRVPGPPYLPVSFSMLILDGRRPANGNEAPGLWEVLSLSAWAPPGAMPALALPTAGWASRDIQFRAARTRYYALAKLLHPDRWALTWATARLIVPRVWQPIVDVGDDDADATHCGTGGDAAGSGAGGVSSAKDAPSEPGTGSGTSEHETAAPQSAAHAAASSAKAHPVAAASPRRWTEETLRLAAEEVFRRVRAAYESICALKS